MLIEYLQDAEYAMFEARNQVSGSDADFVSREDLEKIRVQIECIVKKANEAKAA